MINKRLVSFSRIFTCFAAIFLIGVFSATFLSLNFEIIRPIFPLTAALLLLVAFINFILKNSLLVFISWLLLFLVLGIFYFSYREDLSKTDWPFGEEVEITGKIFSKPENAINNQKVILKVSGVKTGSAGVSLDGNPGLVLANLSKRSEIQFGDNIAIKGIIEKPQTFDDFDYAKYLKKYPAYALIKQVNEFHKLGSKPSIKEKIYRPLYHFSDSLVSVLNRNMPEPHASLAAGIILGQKTNIPDDLSSALSKTGLSHIISLSGFNVTIIVAAIADYFLTYLGRRKVFFFGSLLVLIFIIATGMAPSVVRAAIFSLLIIFGKTIGRRGDKLNLMLLAALILVLYNPFMLRYDVGFQLSFLAFAGIMYFSPLFLEKLERRDFPLCNYIRAPLADTLGAQVVTLPLLLANFGRLSLVAPLANVVVIWILPYTMAAGFIAVFAGLASNELGRISSYFLWPSLEYVIRATMLFSKLPLASLEVNKSWLVEVFGYLFLVLFLFFQKRSARLKTI